MFGKFLMDVIQWPLHAYKNMLGGTYLPTVAGVGVAYYLYDFPVGAQDAQQFLLGYAVAGVVQSALDMQCGDASLASSQYA